MKDRTLSYKGKQITVFGLKKSGKAAIDLLAKSGAQIFATEKNPEIESQLIIWLEDLNVPFELGFHSRRSIEMKDLIVLSPGVDPNIPILKEAKKNQIPIIGEIELAYQFSRSSFLAVTGTSGKSTTVELIGKILSQHIPRVFVCGNIGIPISEIVSLNNQSSTLVVEVSSFQLETIQTFRPTVSVFLNFSEDHLDRYPSMEEYFHAKTKIFENQTMEDAALLNIDSPPLRKLVLPHIRTYYYSIQEPLKQGFYLQGNQIIGKIGNLDFSVKLDGYPLIGLHNQSNAVAAVGASYLYLKDKFDPSAAEKALQCFTGLPHRFEYVGRYAGLDFINDSKSTKPQTTIMALQCITKPTVLIIGGSDKGNDFSSLAKTISQHELIRYVVLTGKTQKKIRCAFDQAGFKKYKNTPTFKSAIFEAISRAKMGDTVLLSPACASFDEFKGFEERGDFFKSTLKLLYESK
ncbi:UDP-N-acetylmuramoyl-L-alanine--D-glutamate ligase [bacterium]|nr:UDP-N-acetylmuramoyl-L-alanine--D-glutamate ligase [bacterium]